MKRLVTIFFFLTSTTYSGISISNEAGVSSTITSFNQNNDDGHRVGHSFFSWVVKNDEIFFCSSTIIDLRDGFVSCIKAKETDSK